ncbi:MAG: hypothetical protein ACLFU8_04935 [Anaerolineales bacterium]
MRRLYRFVSLTLFAMLFIALIGPVSAQNYSFGVPEMRMEVFVNPDASVDIEYDITFANSAFASPIDIVDIGTPHDDYDIGDFRASINGVQLSDIRPSTYIDTGVEIHLGSQAIPAGERGTLHVEFTMPDMVYQDLTDRDFASLQITPTWFDGDLVQGTTDLMVAIHVPAGVEPENVLYQNEPFTQKALYEGRVVGLWRWPDTRLTGPHRVGISFPQSAVDRVVQMTILELMVKWLRDNPSVHFVLGVILFGFFSFLYFRFSGGTGFVLYLLLGGGLVWLMVISPLLHLLLFPVMVLLIILNEATLRRRRKTYLPPIAQVEGGGIKRGLTAPEAAVLLEKPLNEVLTLVIFGLLAKGVVRQVEEDPLQVAVDEDFRSLEQPNITGKASRLRFYRRVAQERGTVVHGYERPFLYLLERHPDQAVKELDFTEAMEGLIKQTAAKMKKFDLSDTRDYYKRVVDRAWKKAQSIGEIPEKEEFLDKNLPWVMLNKQYPTVLRAPGGYSYWPTWMRLSPRVSGSRGGLVNVGGSKSAGRTGAGGRTSLSDVGASFSGWAENTMGGMAAAILPASLGGGVARSGGVLDLSGVDRTTGDIFEAFMKASSSGGGGGGGSGCACACAGCACACACAGGGR